MKTFTINESNFHIPKESHAFLTKYMKRIQSYISKHRLESELYQDILDGIEEKLQEVIDQNGKITQKDCINIVNALGEPEDIFENEESIATPQATPLPENPQQKKKYSFWIKVAIFTFWTVMLFFVFAIKAPAPAIIIIATIIILMARYTVNYHNTRTLIQRDFGRIGETLARIFRNLLTVARFCLFGGIGLMLIGGIIGILFVLGAYFTNFSIYNVDIFALFPWTFGLAGILGVLALIVFAIFFIMWGIKKKSLPTSYIIIATICGFAGVFFAFSAGFSLVATYNSSDSLEQEYQLQIKDPSTTKSIELAMLPYMRSAFGPIELITINMRGATLRVSDDTTLKIKTKIQRHGPETYKGKTTKDIVKQYFTPLELKEKEDNILLYSLNQHLYKDKVPLLFTRVEIEEIYIPKTMKFKGYGLSQITLPEALEKYEPYLRRFHRERDCEYYYYNEETQAFTCKPDQKAINSLIQREIIIPMLRENISTLSPIKHNEKYKREYHDDYDMGLWSDRKITKIERAGNNQELLTIHYNDQSLMITATATFQDIETSASLTKDGAISRQFDGEDAPFVISNFKIQNIVKNPKIYEDKRYQNPEIIEKIPQEINP